MKAKDGVRFLIVIGVFLHVVSYCLLYFGVNYDEVLVAGYLFAALGNPVLILFLGKNIAGHKVKKHFGILVCIGIGGALLCGVLWILGVRCANAQWDNLVNNLFALLSGVCITCVFEANNNAATEIEEALKSRPEGK